MNNHSEAKAVRAIIETYMRGTYEADVPALKRVFHPQAVMNGFLGPQAVLGTPQLFIEDMASSPSMASQECPYHGEIEQIRIEGDVASVILSETGFRGDGTMVNFFHLIKLDGQWKIIAKLFATL